MPTLKGSQLIEALELMGKEAIVRWLPMGGDPKPLVASQALAIAKAGEYEGRQDTKSGKIRYIRQLFDFHAVIEKPAPKPIFTGWHISEGPAIQPSIDYLRRMYGAPCRNNTTREACCVS